MSSKTSIILCTYNEANYIENTISELEKNIPNLEIVIVDDFSSDGTVEIIKKERDWMFIQLSEIAFVEPIPSDSNFILTKIVNIDSKELYNRLLSNGILVRYYENDLLKNYLRISIGSRDQNLKLLDYIKQK